MSTRVNLNGTVFDAEHARISVFDHGFLYGDAIYETLRTYGERPFRFAQHFARLEEAAGRLGIEMPWTATAMRSEVDRTLEAAGPGTERLIRIIVTRGVGAVTPDPDGCREPGLVIFVLPLKELPDDYYLNGVAITISRLKRAPEIAAIKTGNLIHQVLGAREATSRGALETIFLDSEGNLSDGTRSNIWLVRKGRILTPSAQTGIVQGITRALVLELAQETGHNVQEGRYPPQVIGECGEVFLTSTTKGVLGVTRVDGAEVGTGRVGPVTRALENAFRAEIDRFRAKADDDPS